MARHWIQPASLSATLLGLGLVAFLTIQCVARGEEGPAARVSLLASNRTRLSLCVDMADGSPVTQRDVADVARAVDRALATLPEVPSEFGQPTVVAGCPAAIPLTGARLSSDELCCTAARVVADSNLLSEHMVFVYLVDDTLYSRSFGDTPFTRAVSEMLCSDLPIKPSPPTPPHLGWRDNLCAGRTLSLYVPGSTTADTLAQGIAYAVGLYPDEPEPTFDPQGFARSCEQGTPVPGCDRYLDCLTATPNPDCDEFWREIGVVPPD